MPQTTRGNALFEGTPRQAAERNKHTKNVRKHAKTLEGQEENKPISSKQHHEIIIGQ